jgi:hypothetical protein
LFSNRFALKPALSQFFNTPNVKDELVVLQGRNVDYSIAKYLARIFQTSIFVNPNIHGVFSP